MNSVPRVFYEQLLFDFLDTSLSSCGRLSGLIGRVASGLFEKRIWDYSTISDGALTEESLLGIYSRREVDEKEASRRYCTPVIYINGSNASSSVEPDALRKLASSRSQAYLFIHTSCISAELENRLVALRAIRKLYICHRITVRIKEILGKFVQNEVLQQIEFCHREKDYDAQSIELLLALFSQSQFFSALLPQCPIAVLRELFAYWRENPNQMFGKRLWCRSISSFRVVSECFGFRECTEEEQEHLRGLYPVAQGVGKRWPVGQPHEAHICEHKNGAAVYWMIPTAGKSDNFILFH